MSCNNSCENNANLHQSNNCCQHDNNCHSGINYVTIIVLYILLAIIIGSALFIN